MLCIARSEEEVVTIGAGGPAKTYRPDVQIQEPWTVREPSVTEVASEPIHVFLRPTDADVVLDLQRLIDQCYERGRYHLLNYQLALDPPLAPEDSAWANQLLHEHQLL